MVVYVILAPFHTRTNKIAIGFKKYSSLVPKIVFRYGQFASSTFKKGLKIVPVESAHVHDQEILA